MRPNITACACSHGRNSFRTRGVHVKGNRVFVSFITPSAHVGSVRLNIPIDVGVRGNITTVTLTRLDNTASRRVGRNVTDFHKISHHFSFGLGGSQVMFLDSCTRRPTRVTRDIGSIHRLCRSGGVAIVFRPRLCAHAHSFCHSFTSDLSLSSRIVLARVCPTHRRPVPNIADRLVCSGLHPNVRGYVYEGRSILDLLTRGRARMLMILKTNSLSGCTPRVARLLSRGCRNWGSSAFCHSITYRYLPNDNYRDFRPRTRLTNIPEHKANSGERNVYQLRRRRKDDCPTKGRERRPR